MKTVLLVEDQFELRAIHRAYLESHGYAVLQAADGDSALVVAREYTPDVILLDHSLPRRTGLEVLRELKGGPATSHIPVLMMTAHTYGAVGQKARQAGCSAFLSKPCMPHRVLEEINRFATASAGS